MGETGDKEGKIPDAEGMKLGTKILIGVISGIVVGVFLGELSSPLEFAGRVFVDLLQITVLPYILVSLITKIGNLKMAQAKVLAGRAGLVMLLLWVVALGVVALLPLSLPAWEAGTFFSSSLVDRPPAVDFIDLYVPKNPFRSLAESIVPAVVLFSILMGVALIGLKDKDRLLGPMQVVGDALGRITNGVVSLSPYGTFALAAGAAGRLSPPELIRLAGYVSTNTLGVILLTFVALPGLVALLTPYSLGKVISKTRGALLTAFATGKLFAVLTMMHSNVKEMMVERGVPEEEADASAGTLIPLAYPFPNAGKILAILFIPFAAWFVGTPLEWDAYPRLLSVGLLAFFGSPVLAIPFLLDLMRLPTDLLALFLVAGIWCARIGDVVGAMHLAAFTLICDSWNRGWMKFHRTRLVPIAAATGIATVALMGLNYLAVSESLRVLPPSVDKVKGMEFYNRLAEEIGEAVAGPNPQPIEEGKGRLERIHSSGILRVGYREEQPPFSYRNAKGEVVGFDIDLAQRLAWDLGVKLELVPFRGKQIGKSLEEDHFDFATGGITSSVREWGAYQESAPYLFENVALLVEDARVKEFRDVKDLGKRGTVRIGYLTGQRIHRIGLFDQKKIEFAEIPNLEDWVAGKYPEVDALLSSAETGSIYTMIEPRLSVVVPLGLSSRIPTVFATAEDGPFLEMLNVWIRLKREDGTVEVLRDHWIFGKESKTKAPRWSVIRDVLGWGK